MEKCPCHATAEEHAAFEAAYITRLQRDRVFTLGAVVQDDDFDDADGCICGDPECDK